jgi:hypothetical protein
VHARAVALPLERTGQPVRTADEMHRSMGRTDEVLHAASSGGTRSSLSRWHGASTLDSGNQERLADGRERTGVDVRNRVCGQGQG